ncbi:hypothetical protein [Thalassomonas haliotis]|uniref:Uncharacterized protein n=1 Tax=Thalassomonas haliotis TaxID=485448 RepID=A0ABY7V6Q9_9GAMM|nr:hypothetical protein [Thalassomonas haliotis]WDE09393.1 hypothetical protein H3N35_13705 [Thalassomonas haliotis]
MKFLPLISLAAMLLPPATYADNQLLEQALRQELDSHFLQDKIDSIDETDLSIRHELGESWINNSKQHELKVIRDGIDQLGQLMLGTYVVESSPVLATNLADEVTSGRQDYRILRDAHPKGHMCVNASFEVLENEFFPQESFLGNSGRHQAIVRYSNASATPEGDAGKDIRGGALKVLLPEQAHDFLMITAATIPTDNAEQFVNLVKVARVANCIGIIPEGESDGSLSGAIADFEQQVLALGQCIRDGGLSIFDVPEVLLALKRVNDLNKNSEIESVFDKDFFGVTPYAFNDSVFKFEMSPVSCDEPNPEPLLLTAEEESADKGLEHNINRVLSAGSACYDFNLIARPWFLTDKQAIETHKKTWDQLAYYDLTRTKVATVTVSQLEAGANISPLACDNMTFTPGNSAEGFRALGSLNRARTLVYDALADFRHEANAYLRQR